MREILFRGKRVDNGEWIFGYLLKNEHEQSCRIIIDSSYSTESFIGCMSPRVQTETIGQYTGLTDKNGTKIFDGDIVKAKGRFIDEFVSSNYISYYENGSFMLGPINGETIERTLWDFWYNDIDLEIIGNIHDNPSLLEGYGLPEA